MVQTVDFLLFFEFLNCSVVLKHNNPFKSELNLKKMVESITAEQKKEYESIRDNFCKEKEKINLSLNEHKSAIEKSKQKVSGLEKELEDLRPKIDGCDNSVICKRCDIYSMNYLGSSPNPDKHFFYGCVICGFEDQHT